MTLMNKEIKGQIFGYARVSTRDQNLDMQLDVLQRQNCVKIFCEKISRGEKNVRNWNIAFHYYVKAMY